ncbi:MAG: Hsp20/alpha crystallin family protein [Phycisphaerales bacterium]|nr:Hsp20/alpha crystallin family protein [Phycisphaerales bacterium]
MNTSMTNYNTCCGTDALAPRHDNVTKRPQYYRAPIDVYEADGEFTIVADMPGATADGIDLSVEDNTLEVTSTVSNRYENLGRVLHREYGIGDFHRRFRIGDGIDVSQISATCKDGILTVRLPKLAPTGTRTIEVRAE